jgi:hypothetical protein
MNLTIVHSTSAWLPDSKLLWNYNETIPQTRGLTMPSADPEAFDR